MKLLKSLGIFAALLVGMFIIFSLSLRVDDTKKPAQSQSVAAADAAPVTPDAELKHIAILQRDNVNYTNQLNQIKDYFQQVQQKQLATAKDLQDALAAVRKGVDPKKWQFNEDTLTWVAVPQAPPPAPAAPDTKGDQKK